MRPKFANLEAWDQAQILMQPVFIRLVDNLRKQLEDSTLSGTYHDVICWDESVSEATKGRVALLQQELKTTISDERSAEIQLILSELPSAYPGYELRLEQGDRRLTVDLWELCYRICFVTFGDEPVQVDISLFDELGEVEWSRLDEKTQRIVGDVFAAFSSEG